MNVLNGIECAVHFTHEKENDEVLAFYGVKATREFIGRLLYKIPFTEKEHTSETLAFVQTTLYSTNKWLLQHYHIAKGLTFNETNYQQETKRIQEALQKNAFLPTACDGLLTKFGHHQQSHNNCIE